jgi:hypothetical protein
MNYEARPYQRRVGKKNGADLGVDGAHPGGMKAGSRGSKRSETPGLEAARVCIPKGCQRASRSGIRLNCDLTTS